jgi:hypothetical protein
MTTRTTRVPADGYKFLEGPRWRDGELWMAEIGADGRALFCLTYKGAIENIGKAADAQVEIALVDVTGAGSP